MRSRSARVVAVGAAGALAVTLVSPLSAAASTPGGVVVNPDVVYVDGFQGFGTALAWGATVVGTWSNTNREEIADLLFDESGLNLSIARYFVGSGQNPDAETLGCLPYRTGADAPTFKPGPTTWDWNADPGQRWFLDAALDRGVGLTEGVFSSPPWWLTVSGCTNGNANGANSNVDDADLQEYAEYIADVTEHFADSYGMPFDTITPMNEPDADWWDKDTADHPGTKLTVAQQDALILYLADALEDRELATGISATDANHTQNALDAFTAYSSAAKAAVSQLNTHTYHYIYPTYDYTSLPQLRNAATAAGKNLWMSEFGTSAGPFADRNTVLGALNLGGQINQDLNELRANGWVFWDGIESLRVNRDRYDGIGTSWGLIYADYEDPMAETWYTVKMYHGMAQYSRYLQPGMDIIATDDTEMVAGYDSTAGRLVLVVRNASTSSRSLDVDLSHFDLPSGTSLVYRTSGSLDAATQSNIAFDGTELADTLPAESITTYVIDDVDNAATPSQLIAQVSDKCASVDSWSTTDGADILQWTCGATSANQRWELVSVGGGKFQVKSDWSDKCMSVAGWSTTDGGEIVQWACGSGSANQEWYLDAGPDNHNYLRSAHSGKCLSVAGWSTADGAALVQWECGVGSGNQLWSIG